MKKLLCISLVWFIFIAYSSAEEMTNAEIEKSLARLDQVIVQNPKSAQNYIERGDIYYLLNEHQKAATDYTTALSLDKNLDTAYFGRGMAYGRVGLVEEGIADLSVYIARHPDSSVAYTKRGVRNIWIGNMLAAEQDLTRAVELDPSNAEAHDDLGVVYAKKQQLNIAAKHFSTAIRLDPTYQKAYHNLAMCYFIAGHPAQALEEVNAGLKLNADNRNSLLLKSTILQSLGRNEEAKIIADHAEFLPEANWSERSAVGGVLNK